PTPTPTPTFTPTPTRPATECVVDANGNGMSDVVEIMTTGAEPGRLVYLPVVVANWRQPWPTAPPSFAVVPGSTQKICQLTGEFDFAMAAELAVPPEEVPTLNQTLSRYTLFGTDLGASFEHDGKLWFLFGDTFSTHKIPTDPEDGDSSSGPGNPLAADAIAFSTDTDPTNCVSLEFLTQPDNPSVFKNPDFDPDGSTVQQDGISNGRSMYVWYSGLQENHGSKLARSDNNAQDFTFVYDVSTSRFIGISVDILPSTTIPGLPDGGMTDWVLLFGTAKYRESDVYLAAVPLEAIEDRQALRYFSGLDTEGLPQWSASENDAVPIIDTENPLKTGENALGLKDPEKQNAEGCVGELSVHYSEVAEAWIVMYNCEFLSIEMHTAALPWGPWSSPVRVFDPVQDGGYCGFMHVTPEFETALGLDCATNVTIPDRQDPGSPYGPYIMERYTTGDSNRVTLYFVMSTWHPYNTLVMKTELQRQ
ncbi:MAG: DUF4185 domain-containing protein, partial [Anaerolineae bacterium]